MCIRGREGLLFLYFYSGAGAQTQSRAFPWAAHTAQRGHMAGIYLKEVPFSENQLSVKSKTPKQAFQLSHLVLSNVRTARIKKLALRSSSRTPRTETAESGSFTPPGGQPDNDGHQPDTGREGTGLSAFVPGTSGCRSWLLALPTHSSPAPVSTDPK